MDVVFARTRHDYPSYWDFWRLVELSGFTTCYVDQIDLADVARTYIFTPFNGELRALRDKGRRCRVIWWLLERPDAGNNSLADIVTEGLRAADEVWVSDAWYATLDARLRFVLLGSHASFGNRERMPKRYDYAHLSYAWGRRERVYAQMRARGLREAPAAYGIADKDVVLNATRVVLNMHQYEGKMIAPLRFAVAAAYQKPLITEECHDARPFVDGETVLQVGYADIPRRVQQAMAEDVQMKRMALGLHRFLCHERTFGREVRANVK